MSRGKIKKQLCNSVIKNIVIPNIEGDLAHSFPIYVKLNKAHIVMIQNQGIISKETAKLLLQVVSEMEAMGEKPTFFIDPALEGTYFNLEKYVVDRVGREIGGQQHTARSRNDMNAAIVRITLRRVYLKLEERLNQLRKTLIDVALENTETVMAGYTHLQPSEPITFAHYCSAISQALNRDYSRIEHVFESLNLCPLGSGSMASTTWNIDRELLSEFLGFSKPMDNSIDGVASRDFALELLAALTILGNTLSRFCHDLYVWATPEYGYVEVDDSVAVCSSIMPQKKNPYTLEHIKGKIGNIDGFYLGALSGLKNTPYTFACDATGESMHYAVKAVTEMIGCLELLNDTVRTLTTNKNRMLANANRNFCTATELANALVRKEKISFRSAHNVVAEIVLTAMENHKSADGIALEDINTILIKELGRPSTLTNEELKQALDPKLNALSKNIIGGSAVEEVKRQLNVSLVRLSEDKTKLLERQDFIEKAYQRLDEAAEAIVC